jgi:hypothetical protein
MRTATNVGLVIVFFLLLALAGCAEPSPLAPAQEAIKDCQTAAGVWYNCDETPADTRPPAHCNNDPKCFIGPLPWQTEDK